MSWASLESAVNLKLYGIGFGLAAVAVGASKIVSRTGSDLPAHGVICGGPAPSSLVDILSTESIHCWGCPLIALGLATLLTTLVAQASASSERHALNASQA